MERTVWKGLLCLCAALALSAVFGASALATDIDDFDALRDYLFSTDITDVGVILQPIEIPSTVGYVEVYGVKTLKGQGSATITRSAGYGNDLLTVTSGATLTLENVTLDGGSLSATGGSSGTLVYVQDGGTLYMKNGTTLRNNIATLGDGNGGGVYNKGTFIMYRGAAISNTAAGTDGGGVYNAGSFTMNDGLISGGIASGSGGGVANMKNFTMNSGSLTNNQAKGNGGGLYVGSGADFIMNGGSITGNAAYTDPTASINDSNGGGVMVGAGVMTISGASTITGNHKGTGSAATASNLYLSSGRAVQWGAVPSQTTTFGVTAAVAPTDDTPVLIVSGTGVSGLLPTVTSDDPLYRPKQLNTSDTGIILIRPLRIANPPQNASADLGGTATFTVTAAGGSGVSASGASTYSYQWQQNTGVGGAFVDIVGANQASYTVPPVTYDMHGRKYQCVVRDASLPADTLPSGVATLSVKHYITFTIQPAQETVAAQGYITTSLTAAASVSPPEAGGTVLLNWYACDQNGDISATPLPIGVGGTFPIPKTLSAGTYYFICHGHYPSAVGINSTVAKVTVLPLPVLPNSVTGIAAGQSYQRGDTVTFTAHGGGMELNPPYALNTTHWLPFHWETNPSGGFSRRVHPALFHGGHDPRRSYADGYLRLGALRRRKLGGIVPSGNGSGQRALCD